MTIRRPMITDSRTVVKESPYSDVSTMHRKIAALYVQDPSVSLSVVGSNGNISPSMSDTRYRSGPAARNVTGNWPAVTTYPSTSDAASYTVNTYDKISQNLNDTGSIVDYDNYQAKPVYADGAMHIREMSFQDIIDTFINPTIENIRTGTSSSLSGGAYFISTATSIGLCTDLGVVFTDTSTNQSGYAASSIGTAGTYQDPVGSTTNFRLYRNNGDSSAPTRPLIIDYTSNGVNNPAGLREMNDTEFENLFAPLIKKYIYDQSGYTLRYNVDGSGTTKGTAMTNSGLIGVTSTRYIYAASANDYRAQEFPTGTLATLNTWRLKVVKA